MNKESEIVNKVAQSGIITIDLEQVVTDKAQASFDIAPQLFQGLILKEKDFRAFVSEHDWSVYEGKRIAVYCSTDAIVPTWAYMLVTKALMDYTDEVYFCMPEQLDQLVAERAVAVIKPSEYEGKRVVIKGCGDREISSHAFVALSSKLLPYVQSLMFGEPCSTVPIYKKKRV